MAVDANQTAHAGTSIRYSSSQNFGGFRRTTFNSVGTVVAGPTTIGLNIIAGAGAGQTFTAFETPGFYNPYVLNAIDPSRMMVARTNFYESLNRGDSLTNLGAVGGTVGEFFTGGSAIAYGGRLNGVAFPDVFYVAGGTSIKHRVTSGGTISTLASYPGGTVRMLVVDPQRYINVYVLDTSNRVWASFDEGVTWLNLTANLATLTASARTIEIFSPSPTPLNTVLLVGGAGGVWQMRRPSSAGTVWTTLTGGLPKMLVFDLHYDYTDNVLITGTLGRGVWSLTSFFRGGGGTGVPSIPTDFPPPPLPEDGPTGGEVPLDTDYIVPPEALLVENPPE